MRLRPLALSDLEAIRRLRNRNRHAFFDTREVSPEQQRAWFESLSTRPIAFYVIEEEGNVVGTVSVTRTADGSEIGNLIIDEPFRRRGLMRLAIAQLTASPGRYFCDVRAENEPSLRVFQESGFSREFVRLRKQVDGS